MKNSTLTLANINRLWSTQEYFDNIRKRLELSSSDVVRPNYLKGDVELDNERVCELLSCVSASIEELLEYVYYTRV